jgi:hypothetical protein
MATARKRRKTTSRSRSVSRAVKVRTRKALSMTPAKASMYGFAYGGVRPVLANFIAPVTSKIPIAGGYADELGMGIINYFIAKGKFKAFIPKEVGLIGLGIESAVVGQDILGGTLKGGFSGVTKTQNGVQQF